MAILIDPPAWQAHGMLWSHLVSDTGYDELHAFARRLPAPRRGFDLDHYDVPESLYRRALELGAIAVGPKEIVHRLRDSGLRVRQAEREAARPIRRRQYLLAEWSGLGEALGARSGWGNLGDELVSRWNEPHRAYHDERHLEDVLLALDQLVTRGERLSPSTLLAAWFHDAVYTGNGGSDELDSAGLAARALGDLGLDSGLVQSVGDLIVGTTPARRIDDPAAPLAHLLDADLSIFGSPLHRYEQYSLAVRREYAHVADADFSAGRARILVDYLQRATIYRTTAAQDLWERRARANLAREIEGLTGAAAGGRAGLG